MDSNGNRQDKSRRAGRPPAGHPVMTNRAAVRVLYDLAGNKTWPMLANDLDFNAGDVYKKNYPWPSNFGCKEYCDKFLEYAQGSHSSPYATLLAVQKSLERSNALTPEVKAIVENVRPDADEASCATWLHRLMETIIETALPYNRVGKNAARASKEGDGASASTNSQAPTERKPQGVAQAECEAAEGGDAAASGPCEVWPSPGDYLLDGRGNQAFLRAALPSRLFALLPDDLSHLPAVELARELCADSGLACRNIQRACDALASNPGIDEAALVGATTAAFRASQKPEFKNAQTVYQRYSDGDAARALFCATLLWLLGAGLFTRVMSCPATRELFTR